MRRLQMSDHDIERIVGIELEPINISFQTTNPQLLAQDASIVLQEMR